MIEIICGEKGKGKTKELLAKVNAAVQVANGNVVYLDKSQKHMYELNNKVRLINVMDYPVGNCDEFVGFICGIISQDNDLEEMYLDKMRPFISSGHIVKTRNGYAFTKEGMYVSNYILSRIVDFDLIVPGT